MSGRARKVAIVGMPLGMSSAIELTDLHAKSLFIKDVFSTNVNVSAARIDKIIVEDAVIFKGFRAVALKVRGEVFLVNSYIFPAIDMSFCEARRVLLDRCQSPSFDLSSAHITDQAAILFSRISYINFSYSTVSVGINLQSSQIGHVDMIRLLGGNVVIGGKVVSREPRHIPDDFIELTKVVVTTVLEMGTRKTGESVTGSMNLHWAKIEDVDVSTTRFTCKAPSFGDEEIDKRLSHKTYMQTPVAIIDSVVANSITFGRECFELLEHRSGPLVDLSRSIIKIVSIASKANDNRLNSPERWREITPSPIRLAGAEVSSWASATGSLDEASSPDDYLALFECFDGFEPSMLRRVESMYAEKGNLMAADILYVQRRRRARQSTSFIRAPRLRAVSAGLARLSDYLNEVLFGYGTRIKEWIAVAIALWLFTYIGLFVSYNQIFRPSTEFLADLSDASGIPASTFLPLDESKCMSLDIRDKIGVGDAERWVIDSLCEVRPANDSPWRRASNAGLVATANHLPMLGLEPAPQFSTSGKIFGFAPTSIWLQLMRIFNWILLPVLLAVSLSRLFPKRYGGGI